MAMHRWLPVSLIASFTTLMVSAEPPSTAAPSAAKMENMRRSIPVSDDVCTSKGYPPRGGWKQDGCVCIMPGHRCVDKTVDKPANGEVNCTKGACGGSVCAITCNVDFRLKGCNGLSPCERSCGSDGEWTAKHAKCAPLLPGKPHLLNGTAETPTSVVLRWYNDTNTSNGDGPSRSWLVYKETTATHHPFPPEEATHACLTQPCHYVVKNLLPDTTYDFHVQADNRAGVGAPSEVVTLRTLSKTGAVKKQEL